MKKPRYSVEQIIAILKQAELGMPVADLVRKVGISDADVLSLEEAI
jgi:putative transposase